MHSAHFIYTGSLAAQFPSTSLWSREIYPVTNKYILKESMLWASWRSLSPVWHLRLALCGASRATVGHQRNHAHQNPWWRFACQTQDLIIKMFDIYIIYTVNMRNATHTRLYEIRMREMHLDMVKVVFSSLLFALQDTLRNSRRASPSRSWNFSLFFPPDAQTLLARRTAQV